MKRMIHLLIGFILCVSLIGTSILAVASNEEAREIDRRGTTKVDILIHEIMEDDEMDAFGNEADWLYCVGLQEWSG